MHNRTPTPTPFRFEDPEEAEIYRALADQIGPGPAAFFKDAAQLLAAEHDFETRIHLVHHCLRELESALRDALAPIAAETLEEEEVSGNHERDVLLILQGLGIPRDSSVGQSWLAIPKDNPLPRKAHRYRLTVRRRDEELQQFWSDFRRILKAVLDRFEATYLPVFDTLDRLLESSQPSASEVATLLGDVPNNPVSLSYFYGNLEHPGWLEPLRDEGVFRDLPSSVPSTDESEQVHFPPWPPGRYLVNVADQAPSAVRDIILDMPPTENPNVYNQLGDVLLELPPETLRSIADEATSWLERQYVAPILPNKLAEVARKLAEHGHSSAALSLSRCVFQIKPLNGDSLSFARPDVETNFYSSWQFIDEARSTMQLLVASAPRQGISLIGDILENSVYGFVRKRDIEPPEDRSDIWHHAVEKGSSEPRGHELKVPLVNLLREQSESFLETNPDQLEWLIEELGRRPFRIFHRIALHLLRIRCSNAISLVSEWVSNYHLFKDGTVHREYFLLLGECWSALPEAVQKTYLEWIESGPASSAGERYESRWIYRRLIPIGEHLTGDWHERLEELIEEFGPVDPTDFPGSEHLESGFVQRSSPITIGDLAAMTVEEVVGYAQQWKPTEEFMAPTYADLAGAIAKVVQENPERFADRADLFRALRPAYTGALFNGLTEAAKAERRFEWGAALQMGEHVVEQSAGREASIDMSKDEERDWRSTRRSLARMLREGLKDRASAFTFGLREAVWTVLGSLAEDPEPTAEHEEEVLSGGMDPFTLSINTIRGQAIHGVFEYSAWVRRCQQVQTEEPSETGFELVPEARAVLQQHLDPSQETSQAVRSVYGQRFPFLHWFDSTQAEKWVSAIFPEGRDNEQLWTGVWGAYVSYNPPYTDVVPLLIEQYSKAVDLLDTFESDRVRERLSEHLMTLYWWPEPELELEDEDGLIPRFFENADYSLQAHAIQFVGRSLSQTGECVAEGILNRLRALWEWRLSTIEDSPNSERFGEELRAYGWWLTSEQLDPEWCLDRLIETYHLSAQVGFDVYFTIDTLADLAEEFPFRTSRVVEEIVRGDSNGWGVQARREEMRALFATILSTDDAQAQRIVSEIINRLAAQGHLDFRDLLH